MELTTYQKDIISYFKKAPHSNMYISAKAGCGKSFIASQLLQDTEAYSVYIAFNSSIAEEMRGKLHNPKVKIYTMHALCRAILIYNLQNEDGAKTQTGGFGVKKVIVNEKVDTFKIYEILRKQIFVDKEYKYFEYVSFLVEDFVRLYDLVRLKVIDLELASNAKNDIAKIIEEQSLFMHEFFYAPTHEEIYAIIKQLDTLSYNAFEESQSYDFTDMLYITYKKLSNHEWEVPYWACFTNVVIDESQDLSLIQLFLLKFLKRKNGRYVFILDPRQAIYAFSGADSNSYNKIKYLFAPIKEFDLPINYRCASSHLNYVNKIHHIGIMPCDTAPKGMIKTIDKIDCLDLAQAGDFIIGRKNKWLTPIILSLIKRGKAVYIKDEKFVKDIINTIKKTKIKEVDLLNRRLTNKRKKLKDKIIQEEQAMAEYTTHIEDKSEEIEHITIIIDLLNAFKKEHSTNSVNAFLKYVESILNTKPSDDCIIVSSIHCVKGLEATNVFVLNEGKAISEHYMGYEQKQQERNLSYVSLTRAKENLYLVRAQGKEYE